MLMLTTQGDERLALGVDLLVQHHVVSLKLIREAVRGALHLVDQVLSWRFALLND